MAPRGYDRATVDSLEDGFGGAGPHSGIAGTGEAAFTQQQEWYERGRSRVGPLQREYDVQLSVANVDKAWKPK